MPYRWTQASASAPARLTLWPHRSLAAPGFVAFIGATAALIALPLVTQLGTPGLWVMLPFLSGAVAAIWFALRKNHRDREIREELTLTSEALTLTHRKGSAAPLTWTGNPYWTRPTLYPSGARLPNYLTLKGSGREVELGAFLTEEERVTLKTELDRALSDLRASSAAP